MVDERKLRVGWLLRAALRQARRLTDGPGIERVALAVYDPRTDLVSAYAQAGLEVQYLDRHEYLLDSMPGLALVASGREPRVVSDVGPLPHGVPPHVLALRQAGLVSSLTMPLFRGDDLFGFVFFNARQADLFTPSVVWSLRRLMSEIPDLLIRELTRGGGHPA